MLASGVFTGAALAGLSFALQEAGHRTAQQPVAFLPAGLSREIAEVARSMEPDGVPRVRLAENPPAALLKGEPSRPLESGKSGVMARAKKQDPGELKAALARIRNEQRSLAGLPDSSLSALKVGDRALSPRRDLVALDGGQVPTGVPLLAKLGSKVLISAEKLPAGVEPTSRTIVEESGSQRLGILTGVILVQLKDWSSRGELAAVHGLRVQSEKPGIRYLFATLQYPGDDLAQAVAVALASLQQDPKVERAEPEVLFRPAEAK